jgi:hypothetical protein
MRGQVFSGIEFLLLPYKLHMPLQSHTFDLMADADDTKRLFRRSLKRDKKECVGIDHQL